MSAGVAVMWVTAATSTISYSGAVVVPAISGSFGDLTGIGTGVRADRHLQHRPHCPGARESGDYAMGEGRQNRIVQMASRETRLPIDLLAMAGSQGPPDRAIKPTAGLERACLRDVGEAEQ
jgi:hypothetical protein